MVEKCSLIESKVTRACPNVFYSPYTTTGPGLGGENLAVDAAGSLRLGVLGRKTSYFELLSHSSYKQSFPNQLLISFT